MGYETYTGLIAREVDTGEADRYLTILSVERGKLECYARGIRRLKSKLASSAGLMSYGEFQLYRKSEKYILTSAKAFETFYDIRTDVVKYAYATHFLEIARDAVVESQAFPEALQTLLNSLHVLCYRALSPEFISRVFEIRILSLAGFAPMLDYCSVCGRPAPFTGVTAPNTDTSCSYGDMDGGNGGYAGEDGEVTGGAWFAAGGDGLVCGSAECKNSAGRAVAISSGSVRAIKHVSECEAGDIFNFKINGAVSAELAATIPVYLSNKFGRLYDKPDEAERYRVFEREMLENYGKG